MQDEGVIKYVHKTEAEKGGGVGQMLTYLSKGGGRVGEMLKMADKGGRGGGEILTMADKGESRGLDPPIFG